jgi:hypothetical protein
MVPPVAEPVRLITSGCACNRAGFAPVAAVDATPAKPQAPVGAKPAVGRLIGGCSTGCALYSADSGRRRWEPLRGLL